MKCPECSCNPSEPKEDCECDHHNKEKETVAEAKNKKPDWLIAAQKGAEAGQGKDKGKGVTKCPDCGCNPAKPKTGCKCKHHNNNKANKKTVKNESLEDIYQQIIVENNQ